METTLKRVLAIDDDEDYNFLTEVVFEDSGIECDLTFATEASLILEDLKEAKQQPQLILLDINMPIMTGWEFLDQYHNLGLSSEETKIVMISSSIYKEDKNKAKEYPAVVDYIDKPLTVEKLQELVEDYFKG
jgi:CheY-like chemotaxis protein